MRLGSGEWKSSAARVTVRRRSQKGRRLLFFSWILAISTLAGVDAWRGKAGGVSVFCGLYIFGVLMKDFCADRRYYVQVCI